MMKVEDLTEWFPKTVRPNFIGVYEVRPLEGAEGDYSYYSYWSGSGWLPYYLTVDDSYRNRNYDPLSRWQNKVWRGLARPIE